MPPVSVAAFYRFLPLERLSDLRALCQAVCEAREIRGTLLLAPEGLNGTLAGPANALAEALGIIREAAGCTTLTPRMSSHATQPFRRLKVRIKREIVTLGVPDLDIAARPGTRVRPSDWNRLLRDPSIPVIDVRNRFEHAIGTFERALDPGTAAFGDFPGFVARALDPRRNKAVAMFCTGGIRCEKASAFMRAQGFETVYQLDGGILAYLQDVAPEDSLWRGGCFVFDERSAVGPVLAPEPVALCGRCSMPVGGRRTAPGAVTPCCDACAAVRPA